VEQVKIFFKIGNTAAIEREMNEWLATLVNTKITRVLMQSSVSDDFHTGRASPAVTMLVFYADKE